MKQHLSPQQINQWVVGERCTEAQQHMLDCPECRAEAVRLEGALGDFRGAVRRWSNGELCAPPQIDWEKSRPGSWLGWRNLAMLAAAVILCLAAVLFATRFTPSHPATDTAATDVALLKQINAEVSETVPGPMQPLTKLVSWSAADATEEKAQ